MEGRPEKLQAAAGCSPKPPCCFTVKCNGLSLILLIGAQPKRMCTVRKLDCMCTWARQLLCTHVVYCECFAIYTCVCVCGCVYCVKHWRLRNSNPSTSVWVFVWLECLGRSLASISSDRLDLPVIPVFLTISLCINSHIHRCTRGWQACDLPQHQSLPARSAGAASTGNHTQDSIIGYWTISALVLSAFPLLSSGSTFYHLRSEIKFVFPEMRKLSQTCRMMGRFAVLVYSHFSLYIH